MIQGPRPAFRYGLVYNQNGPLSSRNETDGFVATSALPNHNVSIRARLLKQKACESFGVVINIASGEKFAPIR